MKTKLGLLLLMLLIAVWCEDSTHGEQPAKSITNTIGMKFNKIPAGTFLMGSPETEKGRFGEEHQHTVMISRAFYMQTTEVTQSQWKSVMGTEPWKGKPTVKEGPNNAATYVSWNDAVAYCKKLSEKEGKTYRLPTEAEWEYACRAGTETRWSFGDDENKLGDYAWYRENAGGIGEQYAHQVGLKPPNAFGLYDMHGNVFEWCHDYYALHYYKQSPPKDPINGTIGISYHVLRGGAFANHGARGARAAFRYRDHADKGTSINGFRLVHELYVIPNVASETPPPSKALTKYETAAVGYTFGNAKLGMSLSEFRAKNPKADHGTANNGSEQFKKIGLHIAVLNATTNAYSSVVCTFVDGKLIRMTAGYSSTVLGTRIAKIAENVFISLGAAQSEQSSEPWYTKKVMGDNLIAIFTFPNVKREIVLTHQPNSVLSTISLKVTDTDGAKLLKSRE
jgi:sulfatase modifying factor 1